MLAADFPAENVVWDRAVARVNLMDADQLRTWRRVFNPDTPAESKIYDLINKRIFELTGKL